MSRDVGEDKNSERHAQGASKLGQREFRVMTKVRKNAANGLHERGIRCGSWRVIEADREISCQLIKF